MRKSKLTRKQKEHIAAYLFILPSFLGIAVFYIVPYIICFTKSLYVGSRTDDNNKIIGIDNDFMKAYIDIADNVNACTLYQDVSHSYYNDNVIGDIVDNYINKGISKDKFIRQLTSATEIYLTE